MLGLLWRTVRELNLDSTVDVLVAEVPTGCGKSWLLCLLAAAMKDMLGWNVLIATPSDFLAKFAEETYGVHFGICYNQA